MLAIMFSIVLFISCGIALKYGKTYERLTAVTLVAAAFASPLVEKYSFENVEIGIFAIDLWVAVFLVTIALQSDRFWPMWAAAFEIVGVLAHLVRYFQPLKAASYSAVESLWAYPVLIALAVGTLLEGRRRAA